MCTIILKIEFNMGLNMGLNIGHTNMGHTNMGLKIGLPIFYILVINYFSKLLFNVIFY